jgi:hypothetical protein
LLALTQVEAYLGYAAVVGGGGDSAGKLKRD